MYTMSCSYNLVLFISFSTVCVIQYLKYLKQELCVHVFKKKIKSVYEPSGPSEPELIPVSVA